MNEARFTDHTQVGLLDSTDDQMCAGHALRHPTQESHLNFGQFTKAVKVAIKCAWTQWHLKAIVQSVKVLSTMGFVRVASELNWVDRIFGMCF